jgi:hypothetical protein
MTSSQIVATLIDDTTTVAPPSSNEMTVTTRSSPNVSHLLSLPMVLFDLISAMLEPWEWSCIKRASHLCHSFFGGRHHTVSTISATITTLPTSTPSSTSSSSSSANTSSGSWGREIASSMARTASGPWCGEDDCGRCTSHNCANNRPRLCSSHRICSSCLNYGCDICMLPCSRCNRSPLCTTCGSDGAPCWECEHKNIMPIPHKILMPIRLLKPKPK